MSIYSTLERQIGDAFACLLLAEIGRAKLAEVIRRNGIDRDPRVCHSHDFCDANMVMADALLDAASIVDFDADDDEQAALWNRAWFYARERGFAWALAGRVRR